MYKVYHKVSYNDFSKLLRIVTKFKNSFCSPYSLLVLFKTRCFLELENSGRQKNAPYISFFFFK